MLEHPVFKNSIFLFLIKLLELGLPLILLPFLSRNLSIEEFGLYIILISAFSISFMITDFGFGLSAPYNIVNLRDEKERISQYVGAIFIIKIFLSLISIIGIILFFEYVQKNPLLNKISYTLISLIIFFQSFQIPWFFQGIEKMRNITIAVIVAKSMNVIFIFILFEIKQSINIYLLSFMISNFMCSVIYLFLYKKEGYHISYPNRKLLKSELKNSFGFFISRISVTLSTSLNSIIIGTFIGLKYAALYGSAEKLYNAAISSMSPITNSLYPYLARTKNIKTLINITLALLTISILCCYTVSFYSQQIIVIIFGKNYLLASDYFDLFLFLIPINVVSILWGYPAFATIGSPQLANFTVIIGSIIYFILICVFYIMDKISIQNIIYSVIITDVITLFLRLFLFCKKHHKLK
ncbi:putative polysaccharide transporter [Xenorhabdus mauleonii]|uniref:Polysaccharide transporter n=1 Tax=Xenorhabdus mauleonii TaxID=351675 RepID=A0A1I3TXZ9_9GAMM|nr:oligosaccharide flippase family protein [Xenorhabdus mauleonii]PHM39562.1 putative polysaccharide transporter [Xenorhabdus mauleonii]SFJ75353.1 polysaccharide transporter, PST family [Xenorhabdus mauleonii]